MDRERFNRLSKGVGPQDRDELAWLVEHLEALRPHSVIEIGVQEGSSLKFWELLLSPNDLLIGIDSDPRIPDLVKWNWRDSDRRVFIIRGDSTDKETIEKVERILDGRSVDYLFIDGNHEYGHVKSDFLNYSKFVRPGGLVVLHDIGHPDPERVFNEIEGRKDSIHLRFESGGYGYGCWWKE